MDAKSGSRELIHNHEASMDMQWCFRDPPNLAVFTVRQVVEQRRPICYVRHDKDGSWQFLSAETVAAEDAMVVSLAAIIRIDPTIKELADLPLEWEAWRSEPAENWKRGPVS